MENESLFSNILSLLRRDLKKQSKLQRLIKRTNKELANLSECIQKAKSFEYPNDATATLSLPPVLGSSFLSSAFAAGAW